MKLVRIVKNWEWPDLVRQTPGHTSIWDGIQFTGEPVEECDYLIILNNLERELKLSCPPGNVWRIVQEPPTAFFKGWHVNPSYSIKTFTCDPGLSGPQYVRSHPMVPWHVNKDYDYLSTCYVPEKSKTLSWITSTRNVLPGHKKRMNFLYSIMNKVTELDLLGGNIRHILNKEVKDRIEAQQRELGFKTIEDKWAGLAPYKYSLVIESHSSIDYWTEKIADCFLAWTFPIYYGCTNLEDYFPKESFLRIDIEKPDEAIQTIKEIIRKDTWKERLPTLEEARKLVLNKHQFFPFIARHIHSNYLSNQDFSRRKIWLTPGKPSGKQAKLKLSVVVCTYNREKLLPACLESLAHQRAYKNLYEVLVVDNNSSDNTRYVANEFIKKYPNFRYLFELKQGLSHARNLGMKEAAADYVAFIDDDARAGDNWIEHALNIIDEKKPDIFGGPVYPLITDDRPSWYKDEYGIRGDMGETGWLKKGFIVGTNIFFKKSLLQAYGGFDPDLGMKGADIGYHEETRIVFRALKEKKKVYYSKELGVKDQLPDYKKSLAFFIYSKYKSGYDGPKLWNLEFAPSELLNLLKLIKQTMNEINFALLKRDTEQFPYPENYIIEKSIMKFFSIGQMVEFFLKEDKLMEKLLDSYLNKENNA
jgi:glycosyltransferase involved in cell wall biosynthesis